MNAGSSDRAPGPASLASCVLVRKDRPDLPGRITVDFAGFDVGDEFVVGYGMDHGEMYRNLPDICVLNDHARRRHDEEVVP